MTAISGETRTSETTPKVESPFRRFAGEFFESWLATTALAVFGLIVVAALFSVVALAYVMPIINTAYDMQPSPSREALPDIPLSMRLPIFILAIALIVVGLWPGLLDSIVDPAGAALLALFG